MEKKKLFRYSARKGVDLNGKDKIYCEVEEFEVIRETEHFYVINDGDFFGVTEKRVSKDARSRYAYPSESEALDNLYHRKMRHIGILEGQLEVAKGALEFAKKKIMERGETSANTEA